MRRLLLLGGSMLFIVNGVSLFFAANCSTVSFDGNGGGRVMTAVCFPNGQGAIPAWLAALVMVVIGGLLASIAIRPRSN
jgi:hypothetical protein